MNVGCVKLPAAIVGTPAGQEIVGCVNVPAAIVGTPAGQETVGCVKVPAAIVGTPAGHEIVCVCAANAEPVNVCAVTVKFGAVPLHAVVEPVPAAIFVAAQLPEVADAALVPAGVPALTDAAVGTPAGQDNAPSANAPLAFVGTPAGQEIAPSENAPVAFVGAPPGHEIAPSEKAPLLFVPTGVPPLTEEVVSDAPLKVGVETDPAGVKLVEPPVVPTSPAAVVVASIIEPVKVSSSVQPLGQVPVLIATSIPLGTPPLAAIAVQVPPLHQ